MARSKKEQDQYLNRRKEMKKLSMRKAREKMRSDPVKHEEAKAKDRERYKKKREGGKIKLVGDLSSRDRRIIRKAWKTRSAKYRSKKKSEKEIADFVESNTPPRSPEPQQGNVQPSTSRQQDIGKKQARKNRDIKNKRIKELEKKLKKAYCKVNRYKKRLSRINKSKEESPRKKVASIVNGMKAVTPEIKKKLLFAEVISKQIKENYKAEKTNIGKRNLAQFVTGKVVKKYRFAEYLASLTSAGSLREKRYYRRVYLKNQMIEAKREVSKFLAKDESSRLTAGKKETITRKKIKKQKRLLNDTLKNLFKKFIMEYSMYKNMSYSLFCKFRPFWIVPPNVTDRNTCLCKVHENIKLLMSKLSYHKILNEKSATALVHSLCCKGDYTKEECLERKCTICSDISITPNEFNSDDQIHYEEWKTIKIPVIIKGTLKMCQKVVKETVHCNKGELLSKLKKTIFPFMQHCSNIKHQFKAVSDIKKILGKDEILLHFDFSENFNCKYTEEIQSAHFGGSKPQITLHTSVCYYSSENLSKPSHKSFCTLSESLRHDPAAITAHLDCVLDKIKKTLVPGLKKIHLVSDGPSTQYKNKTMFYLLANHITRRIKVDECSWNYCEAGHGKGAPDGIGGYLKRTADGLVARGTDIPNYEALVSALTAASSKVEILTVEESAIKNIDLLVPKKDDLVTFKGTMKIHQISWSAKSTHLQARRLTCTECQPEAVCDHYTIGSISSSTQTLSNQKVNKKEKNKRLDYKSVYSDSEEEEESFMKATSSKNDNMSLSDGGIANGDWVAVIYDNIWYPGTVENKQGSNVDVNFMHKNNGNHLYWPLKPDKQTVAIHTILCKIVHPPYPVSSRQFKLQDKDYQQVIDCFDNLM